MREERLTGEDMAGTDRLKRTAMFVPIEEGSRERLIFLRRRVDVRRRGA